MDDGLFIFIIFQLVLCFLAGIGMGRVVMDYRHFDTIAAQCKEKGYIQNNTTTITCSIEKE